MEIKVTGLKPCPFCGGEATIVSLTDWRSNGNIYFPTCLACGAEMPRVSRTVKQAIEAWNRRADNG